MVSNDQNCMLGLKHISGLIPNKIVYVKICVFDGEKHGCCDCLKKKNIQSVLSIFFLFLVII